MTDLDRRLTQLATGGGCGCKWAPDFLSDLLQRVGMDDSPPSLLVGAATADDAAVWRLSETTAIVATTDFFAPIVDDPVAFGEIAATNALSDVYAMGATPLFALAVAAMPKAVLSEEVIASILSGGRRACQRAGVVIAGGHSIDAQEPLYGLAVVGVTSPDRVLTNAAGQVGDVLMLGKPLGVGVLSAANKRGLLDVAAYDEWVAVMTQLNRAGADLSGVAGVHALTDVTGFGLLGHLSEMCRAAGLGAVVRFSDLPLLAAAIGHARDGTTTGAQARNWHSVAETVRMTAPLADWQRCLLSDPQTSGGLLVACAADSVEAVREVFASHGQEAVAVGRLTEPPMALTVDLA